eukprot:185640-Rhodomonas_salina.4
MHTCTHAHAEHTCTSKPASLQASKRGGSGGRRTLEETMLTSASSAIASRTSTFPSFTSAPTYPHPPPAVSFPLASLLLLCAFHPLARALRTHDIATISTPPHLSRQHPRTPWSRPPI